MPPLLRTSRRTWRPDRRRLTAAACLLALVPIAACSGPGAGLPPIPDASATAYTLGPGDRLKVSVFGREEASGEFIVGTDGRIATPLAGGLKASGLTVDQLAAEYKKALETGGFYRDPKVAVEVTDYRPFFIMGEVRKPGSYPFTSGLTVSAAIAEAGGFTVHADRNIAIILRKMPAGLLRGRAGESSTVLPDDIVEVPETLF